MIRRVLGTLYNGGIRRAGGIRYDKRRRCSWVFSRSTRSHRDVPIRHHGHLLRSVLNLGSSRPTGFRGCGCEMCGATNVRDGTKPRENEREEEEACLSISMGAEGFTCVRTWPRKREAVVNGSILPFREMPTHRSR